MIENKIKKVIAREGLILLGVIFFSWLSLYIGNHVMDYEYTIFNYECSYKDHRSKSQTVEIFGKSNNKIYNLKKSLLRDFIKQNPSLFSKTEIEIAKENIPLPDSIYLPDDFQIINLPLGFTKHGLLKRIILASGIGIIIGYFIYLTILVYGWARKVRKNNIVSLKTIIASEVLLMIYAIFIYLLVVSIGVLFELMYELHYPTQKNRFVNEIFNSAYCILYVYVVMQLFRFVSWAFKVLKGKN